MGFQAGRKRAREEGWREAPTEGQQLGVPALRPPLRSQDEDHSPALVRREGGKPHKDYLVSTLVELTPDKIAKLYDGRAGIEADTKEDKKREPRKRWCCLHSWLTACSGVVQEAVLPGRDGREAGGGAIGEGGDGKSAHGSFIVCPC